MLRYLRVLTAVALVILANPGTAVAGTGDELWQIVRDQCVPDQVQSGNPAPCVSVDLAGGAEHGYVVFKDSVGQRQFLLIPTAPIAGIESPALLAPGATNYLAAAWRARSFTEIAAGGAVPRDWISLAVNPVAGRSQNQLHVHIDCLKKDVHESLERFASAVGPAWAPFPVPLSGHTYSARAVESDDLESVNPFAMLAEGLAELGGDMGQHTLMAVGATHRDGTTGFVLLTNSGTGTTTAGETLQDHQSCPKPVGK